MCMHKGANVNKLYEYEFFNWIPLFFGLGFVLIIMAIEEALWVNW